MSQVKEFLLVGSYGSEIAGKSRAGLPGGKGAISSPEKGGTPLLGINANLTSAGDEQREARRHRWSRLRAVRELLAGETWGKDEKAFRVCKCMWVEIAYVVEQWKNSSGLPGHFRSVTTCGSVFLCPLCAAKITERRREELQIAIASAEKIGWHVYMVTFTLQHTKDDRCADVLKKLNKGLGRLKGCRWWKRFENKYGLVGSITALEMMYSFINGFHPHKHILEFSTRDMSPDELATMRDELAMQWQSVLSSIGGYADFSIGVDVKAGNDYIAEYIAKYGHEPKLSKWGAADELAKFPVKGKSKIDDHYTMFQMLDRYLAGDDRAGKVFVEYAHAFRGQWQLRWSKGLRERLGIEEKSDDEIAQDKDITDFVFALYRKEDWHTVRKMPFKILEAGDTMAFSDFQKYLAVHGVMAENPVFELEADKQ